MPLVSEFQNKEVQMLHLVRTDGSAYVARVPSGWSKAQTGVRSVELSQAERNNVDGRSDRTWKDTLKVIQGYDYEYNSRPDRVSSMVNYRDYSENGETPVTFPWEFVTPTGSSTRGISAISCTASVPGSLLPSTPDLGYMASGMMRSSLPTAPAIDLLRSLVELKDFPRSLRAANYAPSSASGLGDAYLNQVFGLQPTARDIATLANVVLGSDSIVRHFVDYERRQVRRRRSRVLSEVTNNWTNLLNANEVRSSLSMRDESGTFWGDVTCHLVPTGYSDQGYWVAPMQLLTSCSGISELRQFATFEYFIPRPTNLVGRMDVYRRKATQLLGGGLGPSTVYALTPWSWLGDWLVDIGGLLRYQESVAANSVVATRNGWVHEARSSMISQLAPTKDWFSSVRRGAFTTCYSSAKEQRRRSGGPYSILQPWELSGSQGAIVGALAVARYSPV